MQVLSTSLPLWRESEAYALSVYQVTTLLIHSSPLLTTTSCVLHSMDCAFLLQLIAQSSVSPFDRCSRVSKQASQRAPRILYCGARIFLLGVDHLYYKNLVGLAVFSWELVDKASLVWSLMFPAMEKLYVAMPLYLSLSSSPGVPNPRAVALCWTTADLEPGCTSGG